MLIATALHSRGGAARAMSLSSAPTSAPPRTASTPPTTSRSTLHGPANTSAATRSSAPPSSRPSVRQTAKSACLPGFQGADVVATEHGRATASPEPQRVASGHRRPTAATAGHEQRLLHLGEQIGALVGRRAVDTETDPDARVDEVSHRRDAGTQAEVRGRAVRDTRPGLREPGDLAGRQVDAVGAPDVAVEPAEPVEVLDGRAAVQLAAVRLLLDGLGEVGVEGQAEPPRERRRLLHQPSRDRERRAGRNRDLDARTRSRLVELGDEALGVGEHRIDVLDELVGWETAVRHAEIHRPTRGDDPDTELAGRLHLRLDQPGSPTREDVVVVEDRRAPGQRELGDPGARGRVLQLRVDPRPRRVQLAQPAEEVGLLGPCARERLVQVVMRVDEAGSDDGAAEVDRLAAVGLRRPSPIATTTPPSTSSQPSRCSVPASSIVTIQPLR